jgi:SAM-dependent methyltransferase
VAALEDIAARLATGGKGRTEAEIQADVRSLLLEAPLYLEDEDLEVFLEAQAQGGRIDVEAGLAVIEVKKRIDSATARNRAADQLLGYVQTRTEEKNQRYVGVLTDGRLWVLYRLRPKEGLAEVSRFRLDGGTDVAALVAWLETVLATAEAVPPTEAEIVRRLGAGSPAAQLDLADLQEIYEACRSEPEVALKRELWGRLLTSALGTHFPDTDELFVLHTYLVVTAELIAHTVVGLPVQGQDSSALLSGQVFRAARLGGVVDADFFDWPARVQGGQRFVASLSRRLVRFDWSNVEHDIMKALYESIIDPKTRKKLGEYYTPDWLAEGIVNEVITDPLDQRVLDPACGSGTFLFWSARRYLCAAEEAGVPNDEAIEGLVVHVAGIDLHPVAVALARVTYLLAIGTERLQAERPSFSVPVYLGDSMRWDQDETLFDKGGITIPTGDEPDRGDPELHFPEAVVGDANRFDQLIAELADRASSRRAGDPLPKIDSILRRYDVPSADQAAVITAFESLCHLHDEGRNHIWGYYVRNLARPFSFTRPDNQVDVLVGNPPWLSFRFMPVGMQECYRALAQERGLWMGGKVATHQDLADLFVARSAELYLAPQGRFGFVMPAGALSRRAYEGFRSGVFEAPGASTRVSFDEPWDLRAVVPDVFPMPSCAVFGRRSTKAGALPGEAKAFFGEVHARGASWSAASRKLLMRKVRIERSGDAKAQSPYASHFYQGATVLPSVLLRVADLPGGPLGVPKGTRKVASLRSSLEKEPWKDLDSLEGIVEAEFVKPVFLGSGIAPFRTLAEIAAIIPWSIGALMDGSDPCLDEHQGLARWWRTAEDHWEKYKGASNKLTLRERLDYQRGLSNQLPVSRHRVLYTQSGNQIAACRVEGSEALIEHKLYWASVASAEEAHYLTAILNSRPLHRVVEPLMSEGLFGKRDIDKYVFVAPFPSFNAQNDSHLALAGLGERAEELAAVVELGEGWGFQKVRRVIREELDKQGITAEIDAAVAELLAIGLDTLEQKSTKITPDLMGRLSDVEAGAKSRRKKKRKPRPISQQPPRSRPRSEESEISSET